VSSIRKLAAFGVLVALIAILAAACVESDPEAAETPADAETVVNSAPQTDEEGNTVPAPTADEAAGEGEGEAAEGEAGEGDVAAGEAAFAASCGGCHANNGLDAGGIGPQLAGAGLTDEGIRTTVNNGRGAMPGGLVSGEDLDNVTAYVLSLQ
jgi:cytochrome c551